MDWLDLEILAACVEAQQRQQEMVPQLAVVLGVPPTEVFYTWALRRCQQRGRLADQNWHYFFHGLECDLRQTQDGRFLRLDFGPNGRTDTLTAWGVLQFIMTSTYPWSDFADLKRYFASHEPPWDEHAGDLGKFGEAWDRLSSLGCFEAADPELEHFLARHQKVGEDGIVRVEFPVETSERLQIDCAVAHRLCVSAKGRN